MANPLKQSFRSRRGIKGALTTKRPSYFAIVKFIVVVIGITYCAYNFNETYEGTEKLRHKDVNVNKGEDPSLVLSSSSSSLNWCDKVSRERSKLDSSVLVTYPCANISPNTRSAVAVYLTQPHGIKDNERNNRSDFNPQDYINAAFALGASLSKHLTRTDTVKLLLIDKENKIPLSHEQMIQLQQIGWIIGQAPHLLNTLPTTSAIGLTEFKCVMVLDADALVVGNIDELLSRNLFYDNDDNPHNDKSYQLAATIDFYHKRWLYFNTGSVLWRTSTKEMKRVYDHTKDESFMQKFESNEVFLNTLFPDRLDEELNSLMVNEGIDGNFVYWGNIVNLGWKYNVQTHVEFEHPTFWMDHKDDDWLIIHYTNKKPWQCPEQHNSPPPQEYVEACHQGLRDGLVVEDSCFCVHTYLWWDALRDSKRELKVKP